MEKFPAVLVITELTKGAEAFYAAVVHREIFMGVRASVPRPH